jgi:tetratricopeptide (TPR) repeat protein
VGAAQTAIGLRALAWAYGWQDRYAEAELFYRRALALTLTKPIGNAALDYSSVFDVSAESLHWRLGDTYFLSGRHREARAEYEAALVLVERDLGPTSRLALGTRRQIIQQDLYLGRALEAEADLRALNAEREAFGYSRNVFEEWRDGELYAALGWLELAETNLRKHLKLMDSTQGRQTKLTQFALRDLGALLIERGRLDEALPMLREAAQRLTEIGGASSHQVALIESRYARGLLASGDALAAEEQARHAWTVLHSFLGPERHETARARHELGRALVALGRQDEGLDHLRAAAATYASQFGESDVRSAEFRFVLGEALLQRSPREAEAMLDAAARLLVDAPGNQLPARVRAERWLATRGLDAATASTRAARR